MLLPLPLFIPELQKGFQCPCEIWGERALFSWDLALFFNLGRSLRTSPYFCGGLLLSLQSIKQMQSEWNASLSLPYLANRDNSNSSSQIFLCLGEFRLTSWGQRTPVYSVLIQHVDNMVSQALVKSLSTTVIPTRIIKGWWHLLLGDEREKGSSCFLLFLYVSA